MILPKLSFILSDLTFALLNTSSELKNTSTLKHTYIPVSCIEHKLLQVPLQFDHFYGLLDIL